LPYEAVLIFLGELQNKMDCLLAYLLKFKLQCSIYYVVCKLLTFIDLLSSPELSNTFVYQEE